MKNLFLFLFLIPFALTINGQTITFTDPTFKNKLLDSSSGNFIAQNLNGDYFMIDANSNNEIEESEALQVSALDVNSSSISSLGGISFFTNLTTLYCDNNLLSNLNVSNLSNIFSLNCSNNQLVNLNVNGLTELQNLNCQSNQLANLNVSGITNLVNLDCSYNQIVNLNLSDLFNLEILNCSNNQISSFDLSSLIGLKTFDCSSNQLLTIDTVSLISVETLNCNSNFITSLAIINLSNLIDLNCSYNLITTLNLINLPNLIDLNCTNNQLNSLTFNGLTELESLNCANNQITTVNLNDLNQLISLNCNNNLIINLDISSLTNLKYLYCNSNLLSTLNLNGLNALLVLSCNNNLITSLNFSNTNNLQSLYCSNNQISTLNLSNLINFQNLFCSNNVLTNLFIKNGSFENNLSFSGNQNLQFICADDSEINYVQDEINNNNYTNCHVNSYCSFTPGGVIYSVQGNVKYDNNNNGCDVLDSVFSNLQLSFSDGTATESLFSNSNGAYSNSVKSGSYTITSQIENSNYFLVSPTTSSVDFTQVGSPFIQNYCITPNGNHADIEIVILPLNSLMAGQDAKYKIIYKNKGTITQSGSVNLIFNDAYFDVVVTNPISTSQNTNNLYWSFNNLNPQETRTIFVTLNLNSTSISTGQILQFIASVTTSNIDESPNDNSITFNQTVVNSMQANDKVCIEGSSVSTSQVGQYVHYCIHFKNNGIAIAQNVVVKDIIDTTKYDFSTLIPIDGSHMFLTRLTNSNTVEFIFENINLEFGNSNSDGYVMFKIKTLPTLTNGDTFTNTASVYYDYRAPLLTNIESTIIQTLSNTTFETSRRFTIYPNPVKEVLNIFTSEPNSVDSITIYNSLGQMVQKIINPINLSLNVSNLNQGIYFLNMTTEKGTTSIKFIKE
ncbi:MAG: DUF7619 domain-containing protein [Flavobacterium sp.]